jgi:hypothetical protein
MHVEQVLGDVPKEDRCKCNEEASDAKKDPEVRPFWKIW